MIRLLARKNIDDKKWNHCVHFGFNGLPYAYSWYLDQIAANWDGIVLADYQAVFPLVWKKKYGIHYIYQPLFAQQLGIFSLEPLDNTLINEVLEKIPAKFRFIEMQTNAGNAIENECFLIREKTNHELNLRADYEQISGHFSGKIKRNLKRAQKFNLKIETKMKPEEFVAFFEKNVPGKIAEYTPWHHFAMLRLIYNSIQNHCGFIVSVVDEKNETCACGFFVSNRTRVINLVPSANQTGKEQGAMSFLINFVIRENCSKQIVLDFEGSMIPGIAAFYKGFGAIEKKYFSLKKNKLPWPLKLFKK